MANLNSNQPDFDWHERGVWIAIHPEDGPDTQFAAATPWACRAELMRALGRPWEALRGAWMIQKFVEARMS